MFPAAPVIYEFFPAPVQLFHAGKRVSLYELLFYVIEGAFHLSFLPWPVAGARIQFRA